MNFFTVNSTMNDWENNFISCTWRSPQQWVVDSVFLQVLVESQPCADPACSNSFQLTCVLVHEEGLVKVENVVIVF